MQCCLAENRGLWSLALSFCRLSLSHPPYRPKMQVLPFLLSWPHLLDLLGFSIQNSFYVQQTVTVFPLCVGQGVPGQLCVEGSGHCRDTVVTANNNS